MSTLPSTGRLPGEQSGEPAHASGQKPPLAPLPAPAVDRARLAPEVLVSVLGSSPVASAVFDLGGTLIEANASLQKLLGLGMDTLNGMTGAELLDGDMGRQCAASIAEVAASGRTRTSTLVSTSRLAPSGNPVALETTYYRLEGPAGPLGVVALISDVTQEHATEGALRLANERLLLVGQVTSLLGEFLDVDRTIERLCDLVVPTFADHCLVDLVTDQGAFQRRINRDARGLHPGKGGWTPPGSIVTYPAESPMVMAVRSGQSQLVEIDPANFDYSVMAPNGRPVDHLLSMGMASVLVAPLWARGSVVGLILLGTSGSGRHFGPDAVAMATQLADRAAVAIDNAMLYEKQQQFALTLQRSLLPPSLPPSLGLSAAARYLPAKDGGSVGGDWYDVIPLSAGRIAIVVGDVMGRGVAAAALMGQVRAALRAYAVQDLAPAHVLECADELVRGLDDDAIVTCVYGIFDPRDERLTFGNAGHVPPLLVRADGTDVVRIDATGPPLGAGGLLAGLQRDAMDPLGLAESPGDDVGRRRRSDASTAYTQVTVKIPRDALLAAYTDGLVESREQDAETGIERLLHVLRVVAGGRLFPAEGSGNGPGDLDVLCDEVLRLMARTSAADDVALLLIRPDPTTRPDVAAVSLDPLPEEVARARAFTLTTLESWGESEALEDAATLVVSELVTNAVRHASSPARLKLSRHDDGLIVEVRDSAAAPPRWRRAALDDEGGRGLMLVSLLSVEWGARILPEGGKAVWCRLAAPRAAAPTKLG